MLPAAQQHLRHMREGRLPRVLFWICERAALDASAKIHANSSLRNNFDIRQITTPLFPLLPTLPTKTCLRLHFVLCLP
jgi:hypothetical protein